MTNLAKIFAIKIGATVIVWCGPLILLPTDWLEAAGFPRQDTYLFIRLLGWAYLALCVGYWFGLKAALAGRRAMGPIWVGVVSNGGACLILTYYAVVGTWTTWGQPLQIIGWGSVVATAMITVGLLRFGVRGEGLAQ